MRDSATGPGRLRLRHVGSRVRPKLLLFRSRDVQYWAMRVTVLVFLASSAAFATNDVDGLFKRGDAAFAAQDMKGARTAWTDACSGPDSKTQFARAVCEHVSGVLDNSTGHLESAAFHYRGALAIWEQLAPERADFHVTTIISLADLLADTGNMSEAEKLLNDARLIVKPLEDSAPQVFASVLAHSGAYYGRSSQPEQGRPLLNDAIARYNRLPKPPLADLAYTLNALAMIDLGGGQYAASESKLRRALAMATESLGEKHPETTGYQINLALVLDVEGRFSQAETLLRRARVLVEARSGPDSLQAAAVLSELSSVECGLGKFGTAEDLAEQTLVILRKDHAPDKPEVVLTEISLASIYLRQHKTADAAKILPEAVRLERGLAVDPRLLADGVRHLGDLRAQQRDWEAARVLYSEAIGIYEQRLGRNHPDLAPVLRDYAAVLKQQRAPRAEVKTVEARVKAIGPRASSKSLMPQS
jgi:tetratricopeptide (TPR) repeat protein